MTLLTTVFAAVVCTVIWYVKAPAKKFRVGSLCLMYWGAALMWTVDAIAEFMELRDEYFTPAPTDMLNDLFLGLSVIALGLVIWLVMLLVSDPAGRVRAVLTKRN